MKNVFFRGSFVSLVALLPLAPVVHAQIVPSLTADTGVHASLDASANADGGGAFVITHTNAQAMLSGNSSAQTTTNARASLGSSSSATLHTHAAALVASDTNVSSVTLSPQKVTLSYKEPAKLFGFIGVWVPVSVSVGATGTTTVAYPWYSFLMSTNQAALTIRAQAAVDKEMVAASSSNRLSANMQTRVLDSLHAVLSSEANIGATTSTSTQ
ncbi:hypothetical protein HKL94_00130 [Candidatus Parcubacteria bacterium]|nr:hypothetical protein [Candidatus Parcubacteria bacterium]